jgi:TPR repeat protein
MRFCHLPRFASLLWLLLVAPSAAQELARADELALNDGLLAYATADFAGALRRLPPLAERNVALAQMMLGRMYANGIGTAPDCALAVQWLTRAASGGMAEAASMLAEFSETGHCLPRDARRALAWYQRAAANGDTHAPSKIGEIYLGRGDVADAAQAERWFARGVTLYDADAYYHLGEMHARGLAFPRDAVEAYTWFTLASNLETSERVDGVTRSMLARDRMREDMMPAQVAEAQKRAAALWMRLLAAPKQRIEQAAVTR